jgi:large subunit ribosomal protein L22
MHIIAKANGVRVTPRKVGPVLALIRGKEIEYSRGVLTHLPRSASEPILKCLNSAVANAENNLDLRAKNLYVRTANVGPSITLKRIRPAAKGSAHRILKRTSNIYIELAEIGIEEDDDLTYSDRDEITADDLKKLDGVEIEKKKEGAK